MVHGKVSGIGWTMSGSSSEFLGYANHSLTAGRSEQMSTTKRDKEYV